MCLSLSRIDEASVPLELSVDILTNNKQHFGEGNNEVCIEKVNSNIAIVSVESAVLVSDV